MKDQRGRWKPREEALDGGEATTMGLPFSNRGTIHRHTLLRH